ncbi:MAG: glycosyltransferase [Acidimicrobiia bacterium]
MVAIVVTGAEAPHLEACLASLGDSDYPDLTVLVFVRGEVDLRARVAAVLPHAYVRAVGDVGFAAAADDALTTVSGAPFLLFVHDDVVVDPPAVRLLVEEAYRSNAAVAGPKLVDVDRPELLRDVGWSVDRFGVPHTDIVRDELDQEQHDAVRDVFFVTDACLLVRADLFAALAGFDVEVDPGARSLDLCWRARLAGARVIVVPDARVRHHEDGGPDAVDPRLASRHQLRTLLTATAGVRLLWILPIAFVMQVAEAMVFLTRRQRDRAAAVLGAWPWNLRRLGSVRAARARAQQLRVVSDAEIHALQFRGSARVTAYVTTALHAPDRVRALSDRGRGLADQTSARLRTVRGGVVLALALSLLVGVRDLVIGRVAAVGTMTPWPAVGDLVRAFTSEWRAAGLGAHAPAPPAFVVASLMRIVTLGNGGLARTVLVLGCLPVAMVGAYQLARRLVGPGWPSLAVFVAYGINPVPRNAIEHGHLGSLLVYAAAPWVALVLFQLAGGIDRRWPRRRTATLAALAVAVATAWWPPAILLPAVIALGVVLALPLTGAGIGPRALARSAVAVTGLASALLLPWPVAFLGAGDRLGALDVVHPPAGSLGELLRFATGANGTGGLGWAPLVVALIVTLLASGDAGRWCARWWGVALVAWALAMLPAWLGTPGPELEGMLVPAALALAMILGIGVATFLGEIQRAGIGWRQASAIVAGALVVLGSFPFLGDVADGRFHQAGDDWPDALSWMSAQADRGPFRALWVGAPDVLPGALHRRGPDAYALTIGGSGDLRDALAPPGGAGTHAVDAAVGDLVHGTTTRLGREIGPMAIRYVVLPTRVAPGAPVSTPTTRRLGARLAQQLDLRELQTAPGAHVYENLAWIPGDAVLAGPVPAAPSSGAPPAVRGRVGDAKATGTVLWSQQYSDAWELHATRGGRHARAYGWANAYSGVRASSGVTFSDQWWRWPAVLLEILIAAWMVRRVLRRGRRRRRPAPDAESAPNTGPVLEESDA